MKAMMPAGDIDGRSATTCRWYCRTRRKNSPHKQLLLFQETPVGLEEKSYLVLASTDPWFNLGFSSMNCEEELKTEETKMMNKEGKNIRSRDTLNIKLNSFICDLLNIKFYFNWLLHCQKLYLTSTNST